MKGDTMRFYAQLIMILLLCAVVFPSSAIASYKVPIDILLLKPEGFKGKKIIVEGKVANSAVIEDKRSALKGEFDLTDGTASIHILTTILPPPNGKKVTVQGELDTESYSNPVIFGSVVWLSIWVWIASLGGLAIVAGVLLGIILKKPTARLDAITNRRANAGSSVREPEIVHPNPPSGDRAPAGTCPKCNHANTPDAQWCEDCGESLRVRSTARPTSTDVVQSRSNETVFFDPEHSDEHPLASLIVIEGDGADRAQTFPLSRNRKHKIGREGEMDFILPEKTISRYHASIWMEDEKFFLSDEDSTSGTLVNGQRVRKSAPIALNDNDTIQMGKMKLLFRMLPGINA